ncbi:unnamed protein product [Chilo suppressalis]|uniref:Coiled-coil domain-containing protein 86 n=1 Tax=Chilo suppressalis TaxID=168631 RepID=A0ABN8AXP0_CHISP|nr:unnamed protein product [Chilo suppressalis]
MHTTWFGLGTMPRQSRSRSNLSEEEKTKRRREQKKINIRRARAKIDEAALEERRKKDRERYKKKKEQGQIKNIKDCTPREQRKIRRIWREKAKKKREKEKEKTKALNFIEENTPPSSPSFSRVNVGRAVTTRNRRRIVAENSYQKKESKIAKYRMRHIKEKT